MIEILDSELQKFMSENKVAKINKYKKENLEEQLKGLSGLTPVCKLVVHYHFSENSDEYAKESGYQYSLDYTDVHAEYRGYELLPAKKEYHSTTYKFSLIEKDNRKKPTHFQLSNYGLENQPQAVNKATVSKMDTWLDYLLRVRDAEQNYILKSNRKIQEFKNKLTPFKKQLTWQGCYNGHIEKNGVLYTFEMNESGRVYHHIKLDGSVPFTLENFAALSDNHYQQTQHILLFYTCDAWHTVSSKTLVAPFSGEYQLKQYLDGLLAAGELNAYDIECLQNLKQTQGHETNYMIEEFPVNPAYKSE